jgi:hypothetical protein
MRGAATAAKPAIVPHICRARRYFLLHGWLLNAIGTCCGPRPPVKDTISIFSLLWIDQVAHALFFASHRSSAANQCGIRPITELSTRPEFSDPQRSHPRLETLPRSSLTEKKGTHGPCFVVCNCAVSCVLCAVLCWLYSNLLLTVCPLTFFLPLTFTLLSPLCSSSSKSSSSHNNIISSFLDCLKQLLRPHHICLSPWKTPWIRRLLPLPVTTVSQGLDVVLSLLFRPSSSPSTARSCCGHNSIRDSLSQPAEVFISDRTTQI